VGTDRRHCLLTLSHHPHRWSVDRFACPAVSGDVNEVCPRHQPLAARKILSFCKSANLCIVMFANNPDLDVCRGYARRVNCMKYSGRKCRLGTYTAEGPAKVPQGCATASIFYNCETLSLYKVSRRREYYVRNLGQSATRFHLSISLHANRLHRTPLFWLRSMVAILFNDRESTR